METVSSSTPVLLAWEWPLFSSPDHTMRSCPFCSMMSYRFTERALARTNVIATASTTEKLDWLRSIPNGATHTVNYRTQNFADEVKAITGGKGVDVIIDFIGRTHWQKNIESLALDGRMTLLAFLSGEIFFVDGFCPSR